MNSKSTDVRMKGFATRSTVEAAVSWIDTVIRELPGRQSETVTLRDAARRILARDIVSPVNVPGFSRSMMDGFAVRAEDTFGATAYNSLSFRILGTSLPGSPFDGTVEPGTAVRIMTGAPLPKGADAVLPVEVTETQMETMIALSEVSPGKHVGLVGEDIQASSIVLSAGRLLRPQDLGVISSIGQSSVAVVCRPRVRILITGNELLPAGTPPAGFQIADANGPMLNALVNRDGGLIEFSGLITDDRATLQAAMAEPTDVALISGGSSVGQEDHAPDILKQLGSLAVHGVAMRPSSPAGMGRIGDTLVFLLPGNPVSCLCAYDFFAGRAIRVLGGRSANWPYRKVEATLSRKLVSTVGRLDYARVKLHGDLAEPIAISGASVLSSTTDADGFVIVPANSEGLPAQASVVVHLYQDRE